MATYIPVSGSFTVFCRRFVDTSFGATIGYNYWACWAIIVASELTAIPLIMEFWTDKVPSWACRLQYQCTHKLSLLNPISIQGPVSGWLLSLF